jgi:hypothetical protein
VGGEDTFLCRRWVAHPVAGDHLLVGPGIR